MEKIIAFPVVLKHHSSNLKSRKKSKENSVAKMSTQFCEIRHQENRG